MLFRSVSLFVNHALADGLHISRFFMNLEQELAAMIRSQNDLYMLTANAETNDDNLHASLTAGTLTVGELQRSAANICRAILRLPAFARLCGQTSELEAAESLSPEEAAMQTMISVTMRREVELPDEAFRGCKRGEYRMFYVTTEAAGMYELTMEVRSTSENDLAQLSATIFCDRTMLKTIALRGSDRTWQRVSVDLGRVWRRTFYLKWFFGQGGMEIRNCTIRLTRPENEEA